MLELDDLGDLYSGTGYMFSSDVRIPSTEVVIRVDKGSIFSFRAPTFPLDGQGYRYDPQTFATQFPEYDHGNEVQIVIEVEGDEINVRFATDINTIGQGVLYRRSVNRETGIESEADVTDWAEFQSRIDSIDPKKYIFRGQPGPFPLRTAFHRTSRSDLARYWDNDVPRLRRNLSPIITHQFDWRDPAQAGNYFNLVQHHGFPTPLLDWTESPFVAAYFAYRTREPHKSGNVRILMLEKDAWTPSFNNPVFVTRVWPHLSIMYLGGFLNPRMLPQQAVNVLTNIDDMEMYIQGAEEGLGRRTLFAFDLPHSDRREVLSHLHTMGITAGSLFPGLDGSCEASKMDMFDDF